MQRPEIRDLTEGDLGRAARLLAGRHQRQRATEPLLDERYERPDICAAEVDALFRTPDASGAVALVEGEVVGFVLGAPRPAPMWGPNVWVEAAGLALTDEAAPELARDLYAHAATRWMAEGRTAHYAIVPSHDVGLVDAWFRLGFGQQHVHAIRPVPESAAPPEPVDFEIRRAGVADIAALAELDLVLDDHQNASPVFSALASPSLEEALADWAEGIHDESLPTFVAVRDGVVVGSAIACAVTKSSMHVGLLQPPDAGFLGFAAVRPTAQGSGIGKALGASVLAWTAEVGYRSAVTDWRATNLLSSRTWPQLGFRPTFLRLHRIVGF